ncbi:MAG: biotin transport system substrate-specific component [Thermoplasmata archaeon]|jgi:biotin transporter BioY|nr:biotin transport system substrate-specific component [Thermoplasmata archaeon]
MAPTTLDGYRQARLRAYLAAQELNWLAKLGLAIGFAGFTALLAQVSIPLPWTPVPLSLVTFAVFLTGTYLGAGWGVTSLAIYLLAGAFGLHVFAPSENAFNPDALWSADRWKVLVPNAAAQTGFTAGYLFGFVAAGAFIGWAVRRRTAGLHGRAFWAVVCGLIALLGGAAIAALFLRGSGSFASDSSGSAYDAGLDAAWLFAAAFLVIAPVVAWLLLRNRNGSEALNHFLVLLAATALVHVPGVVVLKWTLGWSWSQAFALGSTVFLPFDALKAGAAVLASLPFLPTRSELDPEAQA